MLQCSVQLMSALLDDVSKETNEAEPCTLVWPGFSLTGQYSCLSQLDCLNRCVPVVDMLLGVAENSCKRVCGGEEGGGGRGRGEGEGEECSGGRKRQSEY